MLHERVVDVYTLSKKKIPKYRGKFDFRSFVMSNSSKIVIPYSPAWNPFPYSDIMTDNFSSFLILPDGNRKESHFIVWKQVDLYKFVPFLMSYPLNFNKEKLLKIMEIENEQASSYELWNVENHTLKKKNLKDVSKCDDSFVMMKIFPFKETTIQVHARISFLYVGEKSEYIGNPVIFGLPNKDSIGEFIHRFIDFAPNWINNYEMRFVFKKNINSMGQSQNFDDHLFIEECISYYDIICRLIDKS